MRQQVAGMRQARKNILVDKSRVITQNVCFGPSLVLKIQNELDGPSCALLKLKTAAKTTD